MPDEIDKILDVCRSAVKSVDEAAKDVLLEAIFDSRRIFIYGSGRSGLVGQLFAVRLVQLGFDVHFVGEMTTPILTSKDLLILLSNTGKTSSVVQTASIARRIGTKVVSLTANSSSDLASVSDTVLLFDIPEKSKVSPLGSAFENSAHLFFECLVCEIMEKGGITEKEMRGRHAIWVRSLREHRGGGPYAVSGPHVQGELPGVGVYHDHHARPERGDEPLHGFFHGLDLVILLGCHFRHLLCLCSHQQTRLRVRVTV